MPSQERRRLLRTSAAALAAVGATGCLGGGSRSSRDGTTDDSATDENATERRTTGGEATTGEPTTDDRTPDDAESFALPESSVRSVADARVGVANPVARSTVAYDSIMGSSGVLASEGTQFVVAAVQSDDGSGADAAGPPAYDAFELVAGGERFPAVEIEQRTTGAFTTSLAGRGEIKYDDPYANSGGESRVGWVAFEVASPLSADSPAIRCRYAGASAVWDLPGETATALGRRAPDFELRSFDATVAGGDGVELSLTAENVSGIAGEFLAAVYWPTTIADDDESHIVRESVGPNGRVEWSKTVDAEYAASSDGTVTASVEGCVSGTATVSLSATTTER
ncbi:hypothetical protein M0R88_15375 [Halorussus gelatinilyticus]|uniref:Uncharacterized protein n=1 Tax=Halorussus gelatinilyticus TaxID=2937524 RepID=A0A8U0IG84_9EURY|nr:hypothetical protein [Halorussus gelatinilyticus]UPV99887.1 hypothetical protein M0R88_15375 [Halorussus gelatinilyticus]